MTTPTTPAADAHKFFAYADKIGHWSDGPETFVICKAKHVQLGAQTYGPPQAVDSREAALIAERDALRDALVRIIAVDDAHATIHAPDGDDVARMIEWAEAFDAARAALQASRQPQAQQGGGENTARAFIEWCKAQPEDRVPVSIDEALNEFEAALATKETK